MTAPGLGGPAHSRAIPLRAVGDAQPAAVLHGSGLLVRVPDAARFALHKLVVSQRRPPLQTVKVRKDVDQAAAVIACLAEIRPGDLRVALDAADAMPPAFGKQLRAAVKLLPARQKKAISAIA